MSGSKANEKIIVDILQKHYTTLLSLAHAKAAKKNISAEDIMQDLSFKMLQNCELVIRKYNEIGFPYIRMILNNLFIDLVRRGKVDVRASRTYQIKAGVKNSTLPRQEPHLKEIILEKVLTHFDETSETIFDCYLDGYKYEEIAEMLKMPKSTIGTRIFRIKELLKEDHDLQELAVYNN